MLHSMTIGAASSLVYLNHARMKLTACLLVVILCRGDVIVNCELYCVRGGSRNYW